MIRILIVSLIFIVPYEVAFKPTEEFEIKFDLSFKQRPATDETHTVRLNETREEQDRRSSTDQLPYLVLKVKILKLLPEEMRIKVTRDEKMQLFNKKVMEGMEFKLDVGFTNDIKDGIKGYKHVIEFLTSDKKPLSKIVIEFDRDGNYLVNEVKRGKI